MNDKRAFFVVGPESSGTRMLTRSFILASAEECFRWSNVMDPDLLNEIRVSEVPLLVIHRSLPHSGAWPLITKIEKRLIDANYEVQPLAIFRDWFSTIQSQIKRGFVEDQQEAEQNIRKAWREITTLEDVIYVSYEAFCKHISVRRWLFRDRLGLKVPDIQIYYANPQHLESVSI